MFDPASVRIRGPLQVHVEGFWEELLRQGYTPLSARNLLRLTAHLGRWLEAQGLALSTLTKDHFAAFLHHRRRQGYTGFRTHRGLEPLLGYLRGIGAVPTPSPTLDESPVGRFVREYAEYLAQERGLVAGNVAGYSQFARRFAQEVRPRLDWDRLTAAEITGFVLHRSHPSSVAGRKATVAWLRSLLRFLHLRGETAQDLSSCVPAVAGWRLAALPKALETAQIERLLTSFDRSPIGLRDAAIIRLLLRLGLRAGEVASLTLDDVDWSSGEITVRGKGRHLSRLPLPADVGRALAAYVRHGRRRTGPRSVFLFAQAPFSPLRADGITAVAERALRRAGVIAGGAHVLRHTAATQLLRHGASLPEIAHVLRHRHIDTTAIYAKVDLASLSALVRPWPGGMS
jgi:integrase/recombinase XerD